MTGLAVAADGAWAVRTPRLTLAPTVHGAGDVLAALLLAHLLAGRPAPEALAAAISSLWGILAVTAGAGAAELALIAAQDEIRRPTRRFTPDAL
jgi:pyridoxine kinase